jgi:hypothetical protein
MMRVPKRFPDIVPDATATEARVARSAIDAAAAETAMQGRIRGSALRPHDIGSAQMEPAALLFVPFYRVRVAVDGFHVGLSGASVRVRGASIPIPSGGARHDEQEVIVCARRELPFPAHLARRRFGTDSPLASVHLDQLVAASSFDFAGAERVQPNVPPKTAEDDATRVVRAASEPRSGALFSQYEVRVRDVDTWLHPVYFARYRYDGDARRHVEEDCFVALCGRTGGVLAEHHPSAFRSVVARARKLLWD